MTLHPRSFSSFLALSAVLVAPLAAAPLATARTRPAVTSAATSSAATMASVPLARAPVDLAATLALPVASGLVGNARSGRFAWIENENGARNLWLADSRTTRRLTDRHADDGVLLSEATFDASGRLLAYVEGGDPEFPDENAPNAGLADKAPLQQVRLVTLDASGAPVADRIVGAGHSPVFAPDGQRIAFSSGGRLFLADSAGTAPAQMLLDTPGDIETLRWAPDGATLVFSLRRGDHAFVALVDLATKSLRFVDPGLADDIEPAFSPDGKRIAFIRAIDPPPAAPSTAGPETPGRYWSLKVADVASGETRTLWTAPAGMGSRYYGTRTRNLFWSADNQLVFPWERDGWVHAYALAVDGHEGPDAARPRELTPGAGEVEGFILSADGRSLIYAGNQGDSDRRHIRTVSLAGGAPRLLTAGSGIESFPAVAGERIAVIATDVHRPATPMLLTPGKVGKANALAPFPGGASAPPAATRSYVTPEAVTFRSADGLEVHGQIFRPAGARPGQRHPALVFLHGGPRRQMLLGYFPAGYYSNAYAMNQYLASRGYIVLAVNYRGGTGYGDAFRTAPDTGRDGASEYRDVLAGGRYLQGRADVDTQRIGLWGGSWGGYLTALGLARDSDLFAAGVDLHGVHDMVRTPAAGLSPDAADAWRRSSWASSPIASIDRWRSPVLLIHGDDDHNVPFAQSALLERILTGHAIPHETLVFPNERHGFLRTGAWLSAYRALDAFFVRTLTNAPGR